jgi:hypothetical protein
MIALCSDRRACVFKEQPGTLLVVAEYLWDTIGPAPEELGGEAGLERLHRRTRLEPRDAVGERHAHDRRPRPLVNRLDRAGRIRVPADPRFGGPAIPRP